MDELIIKFVKTIFEMPNLSSYAIVAVDDENNTKMCYHGHKLTVYGMLDYIKRDMFVNMKKEDYWQRQNNIEDEKVLPYCKNIITELENTIKEKMHEEEDVND